MTYQKTALVTGASRGIGRAIAVQLAAVGCLVAIHFHVNCAAAEETRRQMPGDGHLLLAADLADPDAAELLALDAQAAFGGRVDILVHNAGLYEPTPLLEDKGFMAWRAAMHRQMQVNFWAGADLASLLAPAMASAGWGRIIQISSRAGLRGEARHAGYAASKAAQISLVRSLAAELGPSGIGCFGVAPGWTETDMAADALAARGEQIRAEIPLGRVNFGRIRALTEGWRHLLEHYILLQERDYEQGQQHGGGCRRQPPTERAARMLALHQHGVRVERHALDRPAVLLGL